MQIPANKIFLVKPSLVTYDEVTPDESIPGKPKFLNIARFEYDPDNISLATESNFVSIFTPEGTYYESTYTDIFSKREYKGCLRYGHDVGDFHVDIIKHDLMLLMKYLFNKKAILPIYNQMVENYLLRIKPFYTTEELYQIVEEIRKDFAGPPRKINYKKKLVLPDEKLSAKLYKTFIG